MPVWFINVPDNSPRHLTGLQCCVCSLLLSGRAARGWGTCWHWQVSQAQPSPSPKPSPGWVSCQHWHCFPAPFVLDKQEKLPEPYPLLLLELLVTRKPRPVMVPLFLLGYFSSLKNCSGPFITVTSEHLPAFNPSAVSRPRKSMVTKAVLTPHIPLFFLFGFFLGH